MLSDQRGGLLPRGGGVLEVEEYVEFLAKEYLSGYVARGGAAVKLVVLGDEAGSRRLSAALADTAADGFVFAAVDAAGTRVHMVDQLFFAIARQVDWVGLAGDVVRRAYEQVGFPAQGGTSSGLSVSEVAASHTITATSASKAWNLAGLKCAQLILSNDADAAAWESFGMWAGHGTSTLGVIANTAAYSAGSGWLDDVVEYLDGNRRLLDELVSEQLPRARMILPEGTYIALIDFRGYGLEGDLGEWFRENAGVAMTDGAACGEAAIGHARFVFALPRPLLQEAVLRMARALDAHLEAAETAA